MNKLILNADQGVQKISKHIYGHFAEHLGRCIYDGFYVGEDSPIANTRGFRDDIIGALKKLHMPNLRWPGGCFADTYHWRDGIGPKKDRPSMVNIHWGGVTENNHVGTHEFFDLCELLSTPGHECEPYVCGNVGSGTVQEMAEWVEYITHPGNSPMADLRRKNGRDEPWKLKYWAIGNENWGCGGDMTAEYYSDLFRQYQVYCRHFGGQGHKLYKIACGLTEDWNQTLLQKCHRWIDGVSIHYYSFTKSWDEKGSATDFGPAEWASTLKFAANIEGFIERTKGQIRRWDNDNRIGIIMDEWGTWFNVEPGTNPGFLYQQNTVRDAVVAGLSMNIFNKHADRIHMANIAQTINVLQAMILTEGGKMILTPTYHAFEMFKGHQDATLVPQYLVCDKYGEDDKTSLPQISASASVDASGKILVTLVNLHHDKAAELKIDLRGYEAKAVTGRVLTSSKMQDKNTFESPDVVAPQKFNAKLAKSTIDVELPAGSVVALEITA